MENTTLVEFINGARARRCSVAHIHGPHGGGKSTKGIADMWSLVADDPDMTMVYMQPTEVQAALLGDFFLASGDAKITAGLRDGRLKLWSFATAVRKVLNVDKPDGFGAKATVCIDLEVVQTAYGEFLLACLLELAILAQRSDNQELRFTLVTLSVNARHRYPVLDPFSAPAIMEIGEEVELPLHLSIGEAFSLGSGVQRILASLLPQAPGADGGIALLFLSAPDYNQFRETRPMQASELPEISLMPRVLQDPALARKIFETRGPAIVRVDPSITITLPFRNVRALVTSYEKMVGVLEGDTGLYMQRFQDVSSCEVDVWEGYARSSIIEGCKVTSTELSLQTYEMSPPECPTSLAYGAELLLLKLLAFRKWPHLPLDEMPLVYLHGRDKSKRLEAVSRLQAMGMMRRNPVVSEPQELTFTGRSAVDWLAHVRNWRVACFLGHIKLAMSALEKRIYVRLAAIIELDVPLAVNPMSPRVMSDIRASACGPAASMVNYGQLWVALSLWEACRRAENNFAKTDVQKLALGQVTLFDPVRINDEVLKLEAVLGLPPATGEEMDERLGPEELLQIQRSLVDAWVTNLIWIPDGWSQTKAGTPLARCAAHNDEIIIDEHSEVIWLDGLRRKGPICAIALEIFRFKNSLRAANLVLVDGLTVAAVSSRMGTADSQHAVKSYYAHRGRVDK